MMSISCTMPMNGTVKSLSMKKTHVFHLQYPSLAFSSSPVRKVSVSGTKCNSAVHENGRLSTSFKPVAFLGKLGGLRFKFPGSSSLDKKRSVNLKASSSDAASYKGYPPMTKKPAWWWRVLACLPYMIPVHIGWIHAEETYDLHSFLELYEWFTYPFLFFLGELPGWFFTFYFFITYLGIVRENRWPHFFRCHMITGMLLEMSLEVCMTVSEFIPSIFIEGQIGMYIWFFISWTFLLTAIGCLFCALRGMYADVPFLSKAAYIQVPY